MMLIRRSVSSHFARPRSIGWFALSVVCLFLSACGALASTAPQTGGTPVPSTPPTQAITLATDQTSYTPSSTINVILTNRRSASVFTMDHQSACSIVSLQRQVGGAWVQVRECLLKSPTRIVEVAPGVTRISLAPGDAPWSAGVYRVVFHYVLNQGDDMAAGMSGESAQFTINR